VGIFGLFFTILNCHTVNPAFKNNKRLSLMKNMSSTITSITITQKFVWSTLVIYKLEYGDGNKYFQVFLQRVIVIFIWFIV